MGFGTRIIIGTPNGYINIHNQTPNTYVEVKSKLPVPEITVVKEIDGNVWFGSPEGAFMLRNDGKYNYYYNERWLPVNRVLDIA